MSKSPQPLWHQRLTPPWCEKFLAHAQSLKLLQWQKFVHLAKKLHAVVIARKSHAKGANVVIVVANHVTKDARTKAEAAANTAVTATMKVVIVKLPNA